MVDQAALYTLHGHCGPITTLFIDRVTPLLAGSGSQDGLLCVWDLQTGMLKTNVKLCCIVTHWISVIYFNEQICQYRFSVQIFSIL